MQLNRTFITGLALACLCSFTPGLANAGGKKGTSRSRSHSSGHYAKGSGSFHKGGHYKNSSTSDQYRKRK